MKKANVKLIVILGVVFVSFSSVITKSSKAPSLIIAFYRLGFTVLLLLPYFLLKKSHELKKIDKKTFFFCILSGIFLALHFATWISSIKYTSIASSTVLVNTHPIFIVIGTIFILKERVSTKAIISIAMSLTGSIIISTGDYSLGNNVLLGDILAILGGLFVAGYMMIGRYARQRISVTTYTFIVYLTCTVVLFLLVIGTKTSLYPYGADEYLRFFTLALLCTILGHSIFNWVLEYVKPTFISTSVLAEPVFATIWAMFIFSEFPTIWQIIGSTIILLGIYRFTKINDTDEKEIPSDKVLLE